MAHLISLFVTITTHAYWAWEWETDAERRQFHKFFKFAN